MLLLIPFLGAKAQYRTVNDKEAASVFQTPGGFSYEDYGAFIGSAPSGSLDPTALDILYARFDKFSSSDNTMIRGFPYSALKSYEASQVAAGKAPIFVTATYAGKKRPVVFQLVAGSFRERGHRAVRELAAGCQRRRFALRKFLDQQLHPLDRVEVFAIVQHVWFELDECAFNYGVLGVLDDRNHFVSNVTWDSPFPQSSAAYFASVASFFSQLKTQAPDIQTLPNIGSSRDPTQFDNIFTSVPGGLAEDIYSWHALPTAYTRNSWYHADLQLLHLARRSEQSSDHARRASFR